MNTQTQFFVIAIALAAISLVFDLLGRTRLVQRMMRAAALSSTVIALTACEAARTAVNVGLSVGQIACIENEIAPFTTASEAEIGCRILSNPAVRDIIERLLAQKRAARRMGFHWSAPPSETDAGAGP